MIDYNLLIVCSTIVVIGVLLLLIVLKSKSFEMRGDLQKKQLSLKTSETVRFDDVSTINIPKKINHLNSYNQEGIVNYYKSFAPSSEIARLEVYQEFTRIISERNLYILSEIVLFLSKNNITSLKENEYNRYIEEKILYFCSIYDNAFSQSSNSFIRSLQIKVMLGVYYYIFADSLRNFYKTVLAEHKNAELDRNAYFRELIELKNNNHNVSLKEIIYTLYKMFYDNTYSDGKLLIKVMIEYNNLLLGIFHDKLKQGIKEYYNSKE